MMGYLYNGYGGGVGTGFGLFGFIVCLVILIDAILLGIWLYQKISKK